MRFVVEVSRLKRSFVLVAMEAPSAEAIQHIDPRMLHEHASRIFGDEWPSNPSDATMVQEHRIVDVENYEGFDENSLPLFSLMADGRLVAPTDEAEERLTEAIRDVLDQCETFCLDDPDDKRRLVEALKNKLIGR